MRQLGRVASALLLTAPRPDRRLWLCGLSSAVQRLRVEWCSGHCCLGAGRRGRNRPLAQAAVRAFLTALPQAFGVSREPQLCPLQLTARQPFVAAAQLKQAAIQSAASSLGPRFLLLQTALFLSLTPTLHPTPQPTSRKHHQSAPRRRWQQHNPQRSPNTTPLGTTQQTKQSWRTMPARSYPRASSRRCTT